MVVVEAAPAAAVAVARTTTDPQTVRRQMFRLSPSITTATITTAMTEHVDPDTVADAIHMRSRTYGQEGELIAERERLRTKLEAEGKVLPINPLRRY